MKIKVLILGSTGLLGNAVTKYFMNNVKYSVFTTYRNQNVMLDERSLYFDVLNMDFSELPTEVDYVINCIGIIKPFMAESIQNAIIINSLFPWKLAEWCDNNNIKLLHITTDCVYSGNKGKYVESDVHDAIDEYGKTKSLGECVKNAMVLRTSIIGEEIHKNASLVSWAKSQKGNTVQGYTTHLWNGVTTTQYAKVCDKIMTQDMYEKGLFHIYAADDISKCGMLELFNKKYNLNLSINPVAPDLCDRTLRSEKDLCTKLDIPTVEKMIWEM